MKRIERVEFGINWANYGTRALLDAGKALMVAPGNQLTPKSNESLTFRPPRPS
jgi:hypothetical protein